VWSGDGACTDGCALAGATAATAAGLTPVYVDGTSTTKSGSTEDIAALFQTAKVWIMPGGVSNTEYDTMSAALRTTLQSFVSNGGGYVGWCAGAFAATAQIGTTGETGLGIFPGSTTPYDTSNYQNSYGASIEDLLWLGVSHYFYLEGGPYFSNLPSTVEVVATYSDHSVAAARAAYGTGRVFLSGVHPEAPAWWWEGTGITDPDGSDVAYAADMIKWASGLEN
jgi:putative intracellular protease/amidase